MSDSCDPVDCSLPGSSVHGISQARILEWVASSFSWVSFWPRDWIHVYCIGRWFFFFFFYHWAIREAQFLLCSTTILFLQAARPKPKSPLASLHCPPSTISHTFDWIFSLFPAQASCILVACMVTLRKCLSICLCPVAISQKPTWGKCSSF